MPSSVDCRGGAAGGAVHLILSTDFPIADVERFGIFAWLRAMVRGYGAAFDIHVYSSDSRDFSDRLDVRHHPLCPASLGSMPVRVRQSLYYAGLLRAAPSMKGIVRAMSPNLPILPEIKRLSRSPVIVEFRYDWASTAATHYAGYKRWLAHPMQRRCMEAADLVVCTTRDLSRIVMTRYGRRAIVIPNFVDEETFRPTGVRSANIVYAGRFHWGKGLTTLITAFVRLAVTHPATNLDLYGGGEQEAELRRSIPCHLAHRVRFFGRRPQSELAQALGTAAVAVLPTITSEGHPKAVIEAMASGTPVVATRVPGLVNLVSHEHNGLLVEPGNEEGLARALARLLDDPGLWSRLSAGALASSRRYSKERILRRQIRIMQICLAGPTRGYEVA